VVSRLSGTGPIPAAMNRCRGLLVSSPSTVRLISTRLAYRPEQSSAGHTGWRYQ